MHLLNGRLFRRVISLTKRSGIALISQGLFRFFDYFIDGE